MMSDNKACSLLALPFEVRALILKHLLQSAQITIVLRPRRIYPYPFHMDNYEAIEGSLLSCRQLHSELTCLFSTLPATAHFPCRAALAGMGQPTSVLPLKPVGHWASNVTLITWTLTASAWPDRARRAMKKLVELFRMNSERLWLLRRFPNTEVMRMEVMLMIKTDHGDTETGSTHTWSWGIKRTRDGKHVWRHVEAQCCGPTCLQSGLVETVGT